MKNLFFLTFAALSVLVTGCKDDNIGNPGQVLANTDEVHSVEVHSAVVEAAVYGNGITDRGVCWGTESLPTLDDSSVSEGSGAGSFTVTLDGLQQGTTYYARAYATTSNDKTIYGSARSFTTKGLPSVEIVSATPDINSISVKATVIGGTDIWGITERGIYYGLTPTPEVGGTKIKAATSGVGDYSIQIEGLDEDTKYYIKAYAVSTYGTAYSEAKEVATLTNGDVAIFWTKLQEASLNYGIVRNASNTEFVMHYTFDTSAGTVTVTYIESSGNRDAKHVTKAVSFDNDYTEATWESVASGGNEFRGISRTESEFSLIGTGGLTLTPSLSATDIYRIYTNTQYGGIKRVSELHKGNHHPSIGPIFESSNLNSESLEYNGEFSSVVGMPGPHGYLFRQNKFQDNKPYIPVTGDKAVFTFGEYLTSQSWMVSDPATQQLMATDLAPFLELWENPDGLYVIADTSDKTIEEGGFFIYSISTKSVGWIKWQLRASD